MNRFDELVEGYRPQSDKELSNAQREVMQKVALAGFPSFVTVCTINPLVR